MADDLREIRNAVILWLVIAAGWAACAKADCVVEITREQGCSNCEVMKPIVAKVTADGCDIRPVDYDKNKAYSHGLIRSARIQLPTFVYVQETPAGFIPVAKISGVVTEGQLRRFCGNPWVVAVGAAARSAMRAIVGSPVPVFPGW